MSNICAARIHAPASAALIDQNASIYRDERGREDFLTASYVLDSVSNLEMRPMWLSTLYLVSFCLSASATRLSPLTGQQQPFFNPTAVTAQTGSEQIFASTGPLHLSALNEHHFTTLKHPAYPYHGLRIKKTDFCDPTVNTYTGYIDIGAKHLFFYFFESRSDPDKDDVMLWTNGGPACSSVMGLFLEHGPCKVISANETKFHPEAWNSNANIFYIDQPVGTGFSYADYGETTETTEDAAQDIAAFIAIFFENFSQFKGRAFHLSGESYAGRYLPLFGSAIYDQNAYLVDAGYTPVNLSSVLIGNGWTDVFTMMESFYDLQCTKAVTHPIQPISTCIRMKEAVPRCNKWLKAACIDQWDKMNCGAAGSFCEAELMLPYFSLGRDYYDFTRHCETDDIDADNACYPEQRNSTDLLNNPATRERLGLDDSAPYFERCNEKLHDTFFFTHVDHLKHTWHYVSELLERDVPILIYAGANDVIANWIGNERWTRKLDWTGHDAFAQEPLREWLFEGKKAGVTRSAGPLTFATIDGAGHLAPLNKPKESLAMLQRWLAREKL